jgi:hypothetical protein
LDLVSVTVVSCLYGQSHDGFLQDWLTALRALDPPPERIILAADRPLFMGELFVVTRRNHDWEWPQAFYLNLALSEVETEWTWIHDIDDIAFPFALEDIEGRDEDVIQFGYVRSDGVTHLPAADSPLNQYVSGSCIRTAALHHLGGFRDVEHQDTDLWQRLLDAGAVFAPADRPRFYYRRHPQARTEREKAAA